MRSFVSVVALAGLSSAHFVLQWPPTAGFDDDLESTSPCGSFTPAVNSSSANVEVDRFAVEIKNVHPVGQWSFRGTTDLNAPYNFTEIVPVVDTTGVGSFCLDYLSAPSDWAGKPGIIQVVDNSPDGILFQCAAVNFVQGSNSTLGPSCTNATGFNAKWTTAEGFAGEPGAPTGSSSALASAATGSPSSTSSGGAAMMTRAVGGLVGSFGAIVAGLII